MNSNIILGHFPLLMYYIPYMQYYLLYMGVNVVGITCLSHRVAHALATTRYDRFFTPPGGEWLQVRVRLATVVTTTTIYIFFFAFFIYINESVFLFRTIQ